MLYKGNPVSQGIAIGEVYRYAPYAATISERAITQDEVGQAVGQYLDLIERTEAEILAIVESLLADSPDKAAIFTAHVEILHDETMNAEIEELIRDELVAPECAIEKVYDKFARLLAKSKNPQIRERVADVKDLKSRMLRIWFGVPEQSLASLPKEVIIVAHDLYPSDTAMLDREKAMGIITEIGGSTSHTAIIARSYEIPAILGVPDAMRTLRDGETVIVDAVDGIIHTSPDIIMQSVYAKKREDYLAYVHKINKYRDVKPVTKDGVYIEVFLNIGSVSPDELAGSLYTDGVGLFRTEFMYISNLILPTEEEQFREYRKVALEFGERPVVMRTLDIGGDKQLECIKLPKEENPFLGMRALRLCFDNLPLFQTQIRAILRAAVYGNLWLMLPMVGSLDDIRTAKKIIADVKAELDRDGISYKNIPVGIMIEIPSIALVADIAASEVDFASIGTNDLCQYLTAVDRMNPAVSKYYQCYHPSMFRIMEQAINAFNKAGKPICVCGEMGGEPLAAAALVGLGIRKLSMGASAVPRIKKLLTGITIPQAEEIARKVLAQPTASDVEFVLSESLKDLI